MNFILFLLTIFGISITCVTCRSALFLKRDNTNNDANNNNGTTNIEDNTITICTKYSAFNNNDTTIKLRGKISVITKLSS